MKITFIAQASILIETKDCRILTDPWYLGTAFNDSWKLFPAPEWDNAILDTIDYLWISHEHPDHFNIPTLRSFPQSFKDRVILLFQKNNSDKLPDALRKFGFKNIQLLSNRKIYPLKGDTRVYVSQIGQMDSSLAVLNSDCTMLNLNDCEANSIDCKNFRKDLGKIDIVLNQFSMAGYNGYYDYEKHLPGVAESIIQNMVDNHRDLDAKISIPFASNLYFCTEDNKYMNAYGNTPNKVYDRFVKEKLELVALYPGDTLDTANPALHSNDIALAKYKELYTNGVKIIDTPPVIALEKIQDAVKRRAAQLREKFPKWMLKKLQAVKVQIPDLNIVVRLSLYTGECSSLASDSDFDLSIYSQPLFFAFDTAWGVQTMGVGARFRIKSNHGVWKWYRIITSLNNAEMYLKFKYLLTMNNINFIRARMNGGLNQLFYQLKRMS